MDGWEHIGCNDTKTVAALNTEHCLEKKKTTNQLHYIINCVIEATWQYWEHRVA